MVDASPTMTAARLSQVVATQTGVPLDFFTLYHGSKPMCGTLEESGVACPPWWLPPFMANHDGQVHSGNQVLAHVDVDDGKPHRDLMSDQSAEQPKPADSPSHGATIGLCTSSALLCAFVFLLSVYAFNGKVPTPFLLCAACTLFSLLQSALYTHLAALPAPCSLHLGPLRHPQRRVPHSVLAGPVA